jgi:hypothetical protein
VLKRGQLIGTLENAEDYEIKKTDPDLVSSIIKKKQISNIPMTPEMNCFIEENAQINVPEKNREKYLQLMKKHRNVFSHDKTDLGRSDLIQDKIHLKTEEPIYVKQFKMPDVHHDYLEQQVKVWLKLGIVQLTRSRYNSPIL